MDELVYCKDCAYAEPNNLDAYHAVKIGVFCTRYKQNTAGIHGCDNGKPKQKTNADRIRAIPDEELAETITEDWCSILCPGGSFFCDGECLNKMIEWLKQECADG